ncbi:MAG TPA: GNAT family N-acetyltransferase [Casimicrobiaceae bacterium]|jgi:predicted GNAT family N-acyltransferase
MKGNDAFAVRRADWRRDGDALRAIRHDVFIVEQGVPEVLEWDDADAVSLHALAVDAKMKPIGCGRLLPDGHIGRMAVLAAWRGRGVGGELLSLLINDARNEGHRRAILNAQVDAIPFYARYGFTVTGDEFEEAGILHRVMERSLAVTASSR